MALQVTVEVVNDVVALEGLVPMIVIYERLHRTGLAAYKPTASSYYYVTATHKASGEVYKRYTKRQLRHALRTRSRPSVTSMHKYSFAGMR